MNTSRLTESVRLQARCLSDSVTERFKAGSEALRQRSETFSDRSSGRYGGGSFALGGRNRPGRSSRSTSFSDTFVERATTLSEYISTGARKLSRDVSNAAMSMYHYLDEKDLQEELFKKLGTFSKRGNSTENQQHPGRCIYPPPIETPVRPIPANTSSHGKRLSPADGGPKEEYLGKNGKRLKPVASGVGALFIDTEYSSSEKKLIVQVTQYGNFAQVEHGQKLYVSFCKVKSNGAVSKKRTEKIVNNKSSSEFSHTYIYSVPFDSFDQMNHSGTSVLVKLKAGGRLIRKRILKRAKLDTDDVDMDPGFRTKKLFL